MITFMQFITESRSAPLYHSTPIEYAFDIINSGGIKPGPHGKGNVISLTRSLDFAKRWDGLDKEAKSKNQLNIIFQINQIKASQRYKIAPYDFFQTNAIGEKQYEKIPKRGTTKYNVKYNEYEEVLWLGRDNMLSLKYVDKILIPRIVFDKYKNMKNQKYVGDDEYDINHNAVLYKLLHHPLSEVLR